MNEQNERNEELLDEQWLSALAGKPEVSADPALNAQADALRRAIQRRNSRLLANAPDADSVLYEKILFRLRQERLLVSRSLWRSPKVWGLAATLVLGVSITFQMHKSAELERLHSAQLAVEETLRSSSGTVLVHENPAVRLAEIELLLKGTGEILQIERLKDGRIIVRVKATTAVLDALNGAFIEPKPADKFGLVTLIICAPQKK
jgi:hypothetical protein